MKKIFTLIFCLSLLMPTAFVFAEATIVITGGTNGDVVLSGTANNSSLTNSPDGLATGCDKKLAVGTSSPGCSLSDIKPIWKNIVEIVLVFATFAIFIGVSFTIIRIMFLKDSQSASEINEAKEKFFYAVIGFVLIVAIAGGFLFAVYQTIGVNSQIIEAIKKILAYSFVDTAYAAGANINLLLPNPTNVTNLYDFMLSVFQTLVRWFIFPAIIFAWFYVGALYVYAQGKPDKLKEAHKRLLYVLIGTVIIMVLQGALIALQQSVANILNN